MVGRMLNARVGTLLYLSWVRSLAACGVATRSGAFFDTITSPCRHEETIKRSRFVAHALRVESGEEALERARALSDAKARHNCFAYRLSSGAERSNGDGEPGGTAGPPILAAITGAELHDVMVVVQRFKPDSAPKLGTGGLVRAYGGAAAACLAAADRERVVARVRGVVHYAPEDTGSVFQLLSEYSPSGGEGVSDDGTLQASFLAPRDAVDSLRERLADATKGRARCILGDSEPD